MPYKSGQEPENLNKQLNRALRHFSGIGPKSMQVLKDRQTEDWEQIKKQKNRIPFSEKKINSLLEEIQVHENALQQNDIGFFIDSFKPKDYWRILKTFYHKASFFDLETSGLGKEHKITVLICLHKNRLYTYVQGQNLDDFLNLLDEIDLLISFNGSSFDVPKVLDSFHIPELLCPHLDLRWVCFHFGYKGGLKKIEQSLDIHRPQEYADMDGEEAVYLWQLWQKTKKQEFLQKLITYCSLDVVSLKYLTEILLFKRPETDMSSLFQSYKRNSGID